jgi:hypothetical protein
MELHRPSGKSFNSNRQIRRGTYPLMIASRRSLTPLTRCVHRPEHKADNSPHPSTTKVKNTFTPNYVCMTSYFSTGIINSMEVSPSWEAASRSAIQEFPNILRNPKVSLPFSQETSTGLYPESDDFSQYHPILSLSKIHFNIIHPPTSWSSSGLSPSGFPTKFLHAFLFSPCVLHDLSALSLLTSSF